MRRSLPFSATTALRPVLLALLAGTASSVVLGACSQKPITVPLRSLERSGKTALVCLREPGAPSPGRPMEECSPGALEAGDFTTFSNHAYGLVTQTTRGEVAVVDLTTGEMVDANPGVPGYNFLPVGAQPVDIVASRGSGAAFVGVAEVNRPGIFALPATMLRGASPSLADFPACALPSRPGAMAMVAATTAVCGGANYAVDTLGDLGNDAHPNGDLSAEGPQKLLVAMPEDGDLLVIDAQKLLDRAPGSFDPCPIERRQKLAVALPPDTPLRGTSLEPECPPVDIPRTPSDTCPVELPPTVAYPTSFEPSPAAMTVSENKLYITDRSAPVIHVLDVSDACAPSELPPLLPTSYNEPYRPVYTSAIAVSPLTHDKKRFVYAVDFTAGSLMAFDVSDTSTSRTPIIRPRPDYAPYSPRDRLALSAPVQDVAFMQRDNPLPDTAGNLRTGILCNPDDNAADRSGDAYRNNDLFSEGAGPRTLRGIFGLATLTNGTMVYIDVDDLDAPCRQYRQQAVNGSTLPSWSTGCGAIGGAGVCDIEQTNLNGATDEWTCRAVVRHELRSVYFVSADPNAGNHVPRFVTYPTLTLKGTNLRTDTSKEGLENPKLLGPADQTFTAVGGELGFAQEANADPRTAERNFVIPDLAEPRAHVDQDWLLTYEGAIPGSAGKVGKIAFSNPDPASRGLFDSSGSFCGIGVLDRDAALVRGRPLLAATSGDDDTGRAEALATWADEHADIVEITNDFLPEEDPYWAAAQDTCSYLRCVTTYGNPDNPTSARSFPITAAYQDRVLTAATSVADATDPTATLPPECCFPTLVTYQVRSSRSWVALGSVTGFNHHTTVDPQTGRCVEAGVDRETSLVCDTSVVRRNGRVFEAPSGAARPHDDPFIFHDAELSFFVYGGDQPSRRDMSFSWRMSGGFGGLALSLGRGSSFVAPQALTYSNAIERAIVTDGSLQGVVVVDVGAVSVTNTFF
jgi:hypothetical protein